jgi:hypothetical protein
MKRSRVLSAAMSVALVTGRHRIGGPRQQQRLPSPQRYIDGVAARRGRGGPGPRPEPVGDAGSGVADHRRRHHTGRPLRVLRRPGQAAVRESGRSRGDATRHSTSSASGGRPGERSRVRSGSAGVAGAAVERWCADHGLRRQAVGQSWSLVDRGARRRVHGPERARSPAAERAAVSLPGSGQEPRRCRDLGAPGGRRSGDAPRRATCAGRNRGSRARVRSGSPGVAGAPVERWCAGHGLRRAAVGERWSLVDRRARRRVDGAERDGAWPGERASLPLPGSGQEPGRCRPMDTPRRGRPASPLIDRVSR